MQMAITVEQITDAVIKAIPGFFNDAIDQLRQGEGAYIRDGEPSGIVAKVGQAVARSACRQYGAQGPNAVGSKGERFERACRPYLDTFNPGNGAQFETPFQGGQCSGVLYVGRYDYDTSSVPPTVGSVTFRARGPISLGEGPIGQSTGVALRHRGAFPVNQGTTIPTCGQPFAPALVAPTQTVTVANSKNGRIVSLSSCTGSDNCGNLPPEVAPPRLAPDPLPPPFRFNPGDGVDIPIDIDLNPDGTITINLGGGPITIDPFPDGDEPGGGGLEPIPPGDQGQPGTPVDVGPEEAAEEEDPSKNLVGVLVQTIQTPPRASKLFNKVESYTKGAYFVYLGGDAGLSLIDTAAITRPNQFYFAPPGCNRFRVVPNPGFTIRVTPYYED